MQPLKKEGLPELYFPHNSSSILYYDNYFLIYHEGGGFEDNQTEAGLAHDAAFAAVAAAEWHRKCSKPKEVQCQCTCTYCVLAHAWQLYFNEVSEKLDKMMELKNKK